MSLSILLIAPEVAADPVAAALRRELDAEVELATTRRAALACLRRHDYGLVLIEDFLASSDPEAAEQLYQAADATPVLEIHSVLSSAERIVRQVRSALLRHRRERSEAAAAAAEKLENELGAALATAQVAPRGGAGLHAARPAARLKGPFPLYNSPRRR